MQPSDYEVIRPVRRGPKWEPRLQGNILALKEQVAKETEEV